MPPAARPPPIAASCCSVRVHRTGDSRGRTPVGHHPTRNSRQTTPQTTTSTKDGPRDCTPPHVFARDTRGTLVVSATGARSRRSPRQRWPRALTRNRPADQVRHPLRGGRRFSRMQPATGADGHVRARTSAKGASTSSYGLLPYSFLQCVLNSLGGVNSDETRWHQVRPGRSSGVGHQPDFRAP